jgi:hypothetical protein
MADGPADDTDADSDDAVPEEAGSESPDSADTDPGDADSTDVDLLDRRVGFDADPDDRWEETGSSDSRDRGTETAGADPRDRPDESENGDEGEAGFSLRLPPIRLPPLFPEDFRILWPSPGEKLHGRVTHRVVAAALVVFDLVDAALALTADSTVLAAVRVVGGALLAATTFGTLGVVYVWEAAAVLAGVGEFTVVPTLTVLLLAGLVREVL